tara:strand:+ start:1002 stop:1577 length:576 start_codon:yes stop_codon:yes gene_type:complete
MKLSAKIIISIVLLSLISCGNKQDLNFYNKLISVPNYLIPDDSRHRSDFCQSNIYLKDSEENTFMSIEICDYGYGKRKKFDKMNLFFEQECTAITDNTQDLKWIEKNSNNRGNYYEFTYDLERDNKYFSVTYFAYEKHFLAVKINSANKDKVNDIVKIVEVMRDENFLNEAVILQDELDNFCLDCKYPYFW